MPSKILALPRIALLFNVGAGKSSNKSAFPNLLTTETGDPIEAARAHLQTLVGQGVTEYPCETFEQIEESARQAVTDGIEVLIAAGGDGTLRAVADALIGTQTALGILPVGTVNVLARELGIPLDKPGRAVEIALHGRTALIDVGRVTVQGLPTDNHAQITRHFLLMCSVGFDAHAVASVNSDLKGVVGTTAYVVSGITTLASYTPCNFTITADDFAPETYHAFSIVVSNAALYGGDFQIAPDALMDDGMFDVSIFTAPNELVPIQNISLLRQMTAAMFGRTEDDPDTRFFRSHRLTIEADTPTAVQVDGDSLGTTPLHLEILPKALAVRLPL